MLFVLSGCGGGASFDSTGDNAIPVISNVTIQNVSTDGTKNIFFTASDADNDVLDINVSATNGTATLVAAGEINFAPSPAYIGYAVITINADDNNGGTASINVIIDETPNILPILNNAAMCVNENTAPGTIGILDVGDTAISSIDLNGTGAANFLVSTNGIVTVAGGAMLDFETTQVYNLTANATNAGGTGADVNVTISVNDLPDIIPVLADEVASVDENSAPGTVIDTITIITPGDRPITAIDLNGTGATNFAVSAAGVITVAAGAVLDYESTTVFNLSARALSASGYSNSVTVTLYLNDVVDTVPVLADGVGTVDEDAGSGTLVASIPITSIGDASITAINLSGLGAGNFTVSIAGLVSVSVTAALDYETTQVYNLIASADNAAGSSANVNLMINVNNVPDILPVLTDSVFNVDENVTTGFIVGTVPIAAGDSAITVGELNGVGSGNFDIDTSGQISVAAGATLDYETTTQYNLTARALNGAGWNLVDANVQIDINDDPASNCDGIDGSVASGRSQLYRLHDTG